MITLTADDTRLLKDVRLFIEPVEVYDASGNLLGLFVPANLGRGKRLDAKLASLFDSAEIRRLNHVVGRGATHEEVWSRIRRLENEITRRKSAGESAFTSEEAVAYIQSLRAQDEAAERPTSQPGTTLEKDRCAAP